MRIRELFLSHYFYDLLRKLLVLQNFFLLLHFRALIICCFFPSIVIAPFVWKLVCSVIGEPGNSPPTFIVALYTYFSYTILITGPTLHARTQ